MTRNLTKSRFKLANECPTKLFYTKKSEYHDTGIEDEFLAALAEGGHQVGELAKAYFPGGHEVKTLDYEQALAETDTLLQQDEVTIYEPAFRFGTLFVRVDILVKRGNQIRLIEVKAKSCRGGGEAQLLNKDGDKLNSKWAPYLEDVAFQKHVVAGAQPDWQISAELMLVDKGQACPTDGLHQKFLLSRDAKGHSHCTQTAPLSEDELASAMLVTIPLHESLRIIFEDRRYGAGEDKQFTQWIDYLALQYAADDRIKPRPGSHCKGCQFRANAEQRAANKKSGFHECWSSTFNLSETQLDQPTVLDLWSHRGKDKILAKKRYLLTDLEAADLGAPKIGVGPMERVERQWLQVELAQGKRGGFELRRGLREIMQGWTYPLHCIDFETMQPAIPMHAGCHPYEQVAFQFSHHLMHADGRVEHAGEWIDSRRGAFPNFDFVRALRAELSSDNGTIFRFHNHENTILCSIREQLIRERAAQPDADELIGFIESITHPRGSSSADTWHAGPRNMVDLHRLTELYYLDARMGGSNSIKQVLPAVLQRSDFLRTKYGEPIYGEPGTIPSHNFQSMCWLELDDAGNVLDPYKLLPTLFEGFDPHDAEELLTREEGKVNNGGAAMTAFARMQYTEMGEAEREALRKGLLMYCELDTLAMVMIIEAWREWPRT
jgi:uncharacterized protein DUF2779